MWTVILARSVQVVVNFLVHPNFGFSEIVSLRSVSLFGEQVSAIGVAIPSERQWFAVASSILLMVYLVDAAAQGWLKGRTEIETQGHRGQLGHSDFHGCSTPFTRSCWCSAFCRRPVSNLPWFLGALLVMAYELGRDFILSRRERLELAETASSAGAGGARQRAGTTGIHAGSRVGTSHWLRPRRTWKQALIQLKGEKADLEELRSILERHRQRPSPCRPKSSTRCVSFSSDTLSRCSRLEWKTWCRMLSHWFARKRPPNMSYCSLLMQPGLPRVFGDRVHLSQVLLNLLMNSIHAVQSRPFDARRIVVEARTDRREGRSRDNCPGFRTWNSRQHRSMRSSSPFLRQSRKAWAWGWRSLARSSRRMAVAYVDRPQDPARRRCLSLYTAAGRRTAAGIIARH